MLLRKCFGLITAVAGLALATPRLHAQDAGALLDLLVKKKLITDQEAEEVRGELTREAAQTSGGKWKISAPINESSSPDRPTAGIPAATRLFTRRLLTRPESTILSRSRSFADVTRRPPTNVASLPNARCIDEISSPPP